MRRLIHAAMLALLFAVPAFAQLTGPITISAQDAGACATALACASFSQNTNAALTLDVSGTFTGTLTVETTVDNSNWRTTFALSSPTLLRASTITAPGSFTVPNVGISGVRVRATAWSSGSAVVSARVGYTSPLWMLEMRSKVVSTPAVSNQASASVAAAVGVKHVADCISFSAGSTTAPALTALTVNLRDGATGAGTVLMSWQVVIPAATGQNVPPFSTCGLNLLGTTNTALTLEFSALLTSLLESVTLTYYDVF